MDIKDFNLTDEDFTLLVKALDYLPESGFAGEIVTSLLTGMLSKERNEKARIEALEKARNRTREQEKGLLKEECRILQGRLLLIHRQLMQEGALKSANDILKK
jgi:hypothetical protein